MHTNNGVNTTKRQYNNHYEVEGNKTRSEIAAFKKKIAERRKQLNDIKVKIRNHIGSHSANQKQAAKLEKRIGQLEQQISDIKHDARASSDAALSARNSAERWSPSGVASALVDVVSTVAMPLIESSRVLGRFALNHPRTTAAALVIGYALQSYAEGMNIPPLASSANTNKSPTSPLPELPTTPAAGTMTSESASSDASSAAPSSRPLTATTQQSTLASSSATSTRLSAGQSSSQPFSSHQTSFATLSSSYTAGTTASASTQGASPATSIPLSTGQSSSQPLPNQASTSILSDSPSAIAQQNNLTITTTNQLSFSHSTEQSEPSATQCTELKYKEVLKKSCKGEAFKNDPLDCVNKMKELNDCEDLQANQFLINKKSLLNRRIYQKNIKMKRNAVVAIKNIKQNTQEETKKLEDARKQLDDIRKITTTPKPTTTTTTTTIIPTTTTPKPLVTSGASDKIRVASNGLPTSVTMENYGSYAISSTIKYKMPNGQVHEEAKGVITSFFSHSYEVPSDAEEVTLTMYSGELDWQWPPIQPKEMKKIKICAENNIYMNNDCSVNVFRVRTHGSNWNKSISYRSSNTDKLSDVAKSQRGQCKFN